MALEGRRSNIKKNEVPIEQVSLFIYLGCDIGYKCETL